LDHGQTDLLERARRGDTAAFGLLAETHAPALYRLAVALTRNHVDAEDLVQETLLGALERIGGFEGRSTLKTWLSRILIFQVWKQRRRAKVRRAIRLSDDNGEPIDLPAPVSGPAESTERKIDVMRMLSTLSPEFRETLILREFEGFSYEEIAKALDIPQGTVESRIFRARQELKARFAGYNK
jgi:RNA polymerase sigma-70 factor, ECF subfamily